MAIPPHDRNILQTQNGNGTFASSQDGEWKRVKNREKDFASVSLLV
jgi:hypothetical protein